MVSNLLDTTITAIATPSGEGGIAVVRLSGKDAFRIADKIWSGKSLASANSHTVHFGNIAVNGEIIDEALATVFKAPNSFTGEDVVEFSCHGSKWIQRKIISLLIDAGACMAGPGEFSQRAFLNGKIDLAQAEGIADLIAASSAAAHKMAVSQLKGRFSRRLEDLRNMLVDIASLLELELDFSEEDVEFADRRQLLDLCDTIINATASLADSYSTGEALKEGVPVVIAGCPNAGKSSLLNILLQEEKAIVTDIPGTTRDIIEDKVEINGILFRFIDTAGLRDTQDSIERIGIDRAQQRLRNANLILWLFDPTAPLEPQLREYDAFTPTATQTRITVISKSDLATSDGSLLPEESKEIISTKNGNGIDHLKQTLTKLATADSNPETDLIVTNARHYEALLRSNHALRRAKEAIESGISADLIAQDIREATSALGTITGAITTETLLQTIFSRFCIGK